MISYQTKQVQRQNCQYLTFLEKIDLLQYPFHTYLFLLFKTILLLVFLYSFFFTNLYLSYLSQILKSSQQRLKRMIMLTLMLRYNHSALNNLCVRIEDNKLYLFYFIFSFLFSFLIFGQRIRGQSDIKHNCHKLSQHHISQSWSHRLYIMQKDIESSRKIILYHISFRVGQVQCSINYQPSVYKIDTLYLELH